MSDKTKSILKIAIALLMLLGLFVVCYYTCQGIRHDMDLITAKQRDMLETFNRRVPVLDPQRLRQFAEGRLNEETVAEVPLYVRTHGYGYDLKSGRKLTSFPLPASGAAVLATYRYALSYPEVANIYAIFDDQRMIGMIGNYVIPPQMLPIPVEAGGLNAFGPWTHYFGCAAFATTHRPCSDDPRLLSDIKNSALARQQTITLYFPFVYPMQGQQGYRYGLLAINIAIAEAFHEVLQPFDELNPTRAALSFDAAEPCRPWHLCLGKPLMQIKTGRPLYLNWSYTYADFTKLVLYGTPFTVYVITVLLLFLLGPHVYQLLLAHSQTDRLTLLPRRDLLDEVMLRKYNFLMMLDIDNFKSINDSHGHHVGDMVLAAFARHLECNIRKRDVALRWGGEEFVILFQGVDEESMRKAASRLLAQPLWLAELPTPVTFSAGMVQISEYFKVADAISLADRLLYYVKRHGKHNIAYYEGRQSRLIRQQPAAGCGTLSSVATVNDH